MDRKAAACLAAGIFAAAAAPLASSAGSVSGCRPGSGDVVCRVTAKLRKGRRVVRDNTPQRLQGPTLVQTSAKGSADLFLGKQADCRMARPTKKGTQLKTRSPRNALFSQRRGKTLCTFSGDYAAVVTGPGTLDSWPLPRSSPLAVINANAPRTQFQIDFEPASSLFVRVKRGQLLVALRNGRKFELAPSIDPYTELIVSLDAHGHIIATARRIPFFSPLDDHIFGTQSEQIG